MLRRLSVCFFIFSLSTCILCWPAAAASQPQVAELNQGWSEQEAQFYNHASEGTNLAPLEFVLNLPDPQRPEAKFIDRVATEYGFIPGEPSDLNPYRLPVGFAIDTRPTQLGDRPYLGITCAACHTRQLSYRSPDASGTDWVLPVNGGPGLADVPRFLGDLYGAFFALLQDDAAMATFAADVLNRAPEPGDLEALRDEIRQFTGPVAATDALMEALGVPGAEFGPGNLNALSQGNYNNAGLLRWLLAEGVMDPSSIELPDENAPLIRMEGAVNYPPMWFSPQDTWAQWFAEIHHPGQRNWIQAVSTSPVRPPKTIAALADKAIVATIDFDNIEAMQASLDRLRTPKWPAKALGELDRELVARGEPIFAANCAQCHVRDFELPNSLGVKFKARLAFDVGTDPVAYQQFEIDAAGRAAGLQNLAEKILELRQFQLERDFGAAAAANYQRYDSQGRPNRFAIAGGAYTSDSTPRRWEQSGATYWAPPMAGIFATSPYLHNGSVPSLSDLLSPPDRRPTTFRTGGNAFDPERVGLNSEGSFLYNTQELGKGNGGHLFGTQLPPAEKAALIEYLKSL